MKYGFTSFSYPELPLAELAEAAARYGYECIELRVGYGQAHGIESDTTSDECTRAADVLARADIALACLGARTSFADPDTVFDETRAARSVIELAGSLGTPVVRVFGGLVGPEIPHSVALACVESALRELAPVAQDQGVAVCIETHDGWTDPAGLAELLTGVDHPSVGVVWDVMHPVFVSGSSIENAFALLQPWIRHVHVHDGFRGPGGIERCPMGCGEIDTRLALSLLEAGGFDGCVSFEWDGPAPAPWTDWNAPEVHLPRELATLGAFERGATPGSVTRGRTA